MVRRKRQRSAATISSSERPSVSEGRGQHPFFVIPAQAGIQPLSPVGGEVGAQRRVRGKEQPNNATLHPHQRRTTPMLTK